MKIKDPEKFSQKVIDVAQAEGLTYLETAILCANTEKIEEESLVDFIIPKLKELIRDQAVSRYMLDKPRTTKIEFE